jgi:hypothetical protein
MIHRQHLQLYTFYPETRPIIFCFPETAKIVVKIPILGLLACIWL